MDVRFALLLGLIAGITNIIPYAGPIIGFIPALLLSLVNSSAESTLWAISLLYFIANAVDIIFVFPILVSKIVNLHPLFVILGVMLGGQMMGITGMIISIPYIAAIKLILLEVYNELYETS